MTGRKSAHQHAIVSPARNLNERHGAERSEVAHRLSEEHLLIEDPEEPQTASNEVGNNRYALSISHYCYV